MIDTTIELSQGSTNLIELTDLRDAVTKARISDATVVATLYTEAFTPVSGAQNLSLSAVTGAPGTYRGTVAKTVTLPTPTLLVCFTATSGGYARDVWARATVLAKETI